MNTCLRNWLKFIPRKVYHKQYRREGWVCQPAQRGGPHVPEAALPAQLAQCSEASRQSGAHYLRYKDWTCRDKYVRMTTVFDIVSKHGATSQRIDAEGVGRPDVSSAGQLIDCQSKQEDIGCGATGRSRFRFALSASTGWVLLFQPPIQAKPIE